MTRPALGDILPGVFLYIININQPCSSDDLISTLRDGKLKKERVPITRRSAAYKNTISFLIENKLIFKNDDYFFVTLLGLKFISKNKTAFPRDKFRLYSLHEMQKKARRRRKAV